MTENRVYRAEGKADPAGSQSAEEAKGEASSWEKRGCWGASILLTLPHTSDNEHVAANALLH